MKIIETIKKKITSRRERKAYRCKATMMSPVEASLFVEEMFFREHRNVPTIRTLDHDHIENVNATL